MGFVYYCEECGKECEAKYKSLVKRFCSHACANIHRWKTHPGERIALECKTCHKIFYVRPSDNRMKSNQENFYCSRQCAGEAAKKYVMKTCLHCGKAFYASKQKRKFCSQQCARIYRWEHYTPKQYKENGYIVSYINGYNAKGNAKQHRLIMEEAMGRKLGPDEVVHHKNGIKDDNRIENLEVITRSEHSSMHRKKEKAEGKHLFGGYHNN